MRLHTWLLFLLPLPELAAQLAAQTAVQLAGPEAHWGTSIGPVRSPNAASPASQLLASTDADYGSWLQSALARQRLAYQ